MLKSMIKDIERVLRYILTIIYGTYQKKTFFSIHNKLYNAFFHILRTAKIKTFLLQNVKCNII